ncbi:MAG: M56 family metallopeptidase, partial [Planctomycetota bacterium]
MTASLDIVDLPWWAAALADFHVGAAALLLLATLVGSVLRQPVRRLAVAWAAAGSLGLLVLLAVTPGWSLWSVAPVATPARVANAEPLTPPTIGLTAPARPAGSPLEVPRSRVEPTTEPLRSPPLASGSSPTTAGPSINRSSLALTAACVVFVAVTVGVLIWLCVGWRIGRRLVAEADAAPERCSRLLEPLCDTGRSPRLLVSDRLAAPVAIGLRRPAIVLPRPMADAEPDSHLRTLLAHELAHVRGGDLWLLALLRGLMPLLWVNPLYWLLRRRVRLDQEALADAAAADLSSREAYAEQLVDWARQLAGYRPPLAGAAGLWEGPSQLRRR